MAVLSHFLFNSDYSADKLAFAQTGSYTLTSPAGVKYVFVNTHVQTMLYAEGDYKIRGSNVVHSMVHRGVNPSATLRTLMYNGECWIAIEFVYTSDDYNNTIDYRIWAHYGEKDAKNTDISPTANATGRKLVIDSDLNYPRFIMDGYLSMGSQYTHSMGYIPYIKTWILSKNSTMPSPSGSGTISTQYYFQDQIGFFGNAANSSYSAQIVQVTNNQVSTFPAQYPGDGVGVYFRLYQL